MDRGQIEDAFKLRGTIEPSVGGQGKRVLEQSRGCRMQIQTKKAFTDVRLSLPLRALWSSIDGVAYADEP